MATDSSNALSSALTGGADTIVARATPAGRGALAVVRLSGPGVRSAAARVCPELDCEKPWRAQLVDLYDAEGTLLERGIAIAYAAPRSYTGEDMAEVTLHGSPYLVDGVVASFRAAGARPAGPGEFTRRAVANGKLDLVQAEAVADLIAAETAEQARFARRQLVGDLSSRLTDLHGSLVDLLARFEASLDFALHDVAVDTDDLEVRCRRSVEVLSSLVATARGGRLIRDGVRIVIVGPPNAGKSTLFNHLLGRERAIVAPDAGTTRDVLEGEIDIGGMPVVLVDTAGLRENVEAVEAEGVRRARAAVESADALLVLSPADGGAADGSSVPEGTVPVLKILSKADLGEPEPTDEMYRLSFMTGEGADGLGVAVRRLIEDEVVDLGGQVAINRRHEMRLRSALAELESVDVSEPELAAERVRWTLAELGGVLGFEISEEVLDRVFDSFCIGK